MAKREDIETAIWSDPDFLALSGPARAVYIWSFTNQRAGMSGIYKVAREQVAMETGFDGKPLERALAELQEKRYLFYDDRVAFVRTKVKRSRNRSENIAKSIRSDVEALHDHPFVALWWEENENQGWVTDQMAKPAFTGDLEGSTKPPSGPPQGVHGYGSVYVPVSVVVEEQQRQEEQLPSDFPDDLVPHLDVVVPVLQEVAKRHHAKAVSRYQVAMTVKTRTRKPLVRGAHDCAAHWDRKGQRLRDVTAAYRNWLDRCDDLAGPEPIGAGIGGNGRPSMPRAAVARRNALMETD